MVGRTLEWLSRLEGFLGVALSDEDVALPNQVWYLRTDLANVRAATDHYDALKICVDYRVLIKELMMSMYLVSDGVELFERLSHAKYFTKLNLWSERRQVQIAAEDDPETSM